MHRGCFAVLTNLQCEIFIYVLFLSAFLSSSLEITSVSLLICFHPRFLYCKGCCDSWFHQIPVTLTALVGLNHTYLACLEKSLVYEGPARSLNGNTRNQGYLTVLLCNMKVYTGVQCKV